MDIAKLLITKVVDQQDISLLLQSGLDKPWLNDPDSIAVFDGSNRSAYLYILDTYEKYGQLPDREQILEDHNPAYKFESTDRNLEWLIDSALAAYKRSIVDLSVGDFVSAFDADNIDSAIDVARNLIAKAERSVRQENTVVTLNETAKDIWSFLDRERQFGIPVGIKSLDENFGGFQEGQLITFLGRNKGMKTWHMIKSALSAWEAGFDSVFFSVELNADQIQERMWASLAEVSYDRLKKGDLHSSERTRVDEAAKMLASDGQSQIQIERNSVSLSVLDLKIAIERYHPHIVFVDGFYFMVDRETGKSGTNWEAHENLAKELKILAEEMGIVIVVSTQVQEKQHNEKAGIEGRTMMGGTGLIKASDLVIGVDRPNESYFQKLSTIASRESELIDLTLQWDWSTMQFEEVEGYFAPDGDDDANFDF